MKIQLSTAAIGLALLMAVTACGNSPDTGSSSPDPGAENDVTSSELPGIDHWLAITDSIGVEMGDSNFVFGQISAVQFLPDGNIAIADMLKARISLFSPEGEFIGTVGREGSGPGEFLMLATFAVRADGSFMVPDVMAGKLNFYDSNYSFTEEMTGFFPQPPVMISPVENGFVGLKAEFEQNEDEMNVGMGIYLWTDSVAHDMEFERNMIVFDMNDIGASVKTMVFFDTDRNDNVVTAPYSTEEYIITSRNLAGEQVWQIIEEYPRVRKTDEEMQEERDLIRSRMVASGTPAAMADNFQIEEYKTFIKQLDTGNLNRLWVLQGIYDTPVYRVYDCATGEFLFTAALRADEAHEQDVPFISEYGIAGFVPDGGDWPFVYIITPEDPGLFQAE